MVKENIFSKTSNVKSFADYLSKELERRKQLDEFEALKKSNDEREKNLLSNITTSNIIDGINIVEGLMSVADNSQTNKKLSEKEIFNEKNEYKTISFIKGERTYKNCKVFVSNAKVKGDDRLAIAVPIKHNNGSVEIITSANSRLQSVLKLLYKDYLKNLPNRKKTNEIEYYSSNPVIGFDYITFSYSKDKLEISSTGEKIELLKNSVKNFDIIGSLEKYKEMYPARFNKCDSRENIIGVGGEAHYYSYLINKYGEANVLWINKDGESGKEYDFILTFAGKKYFIDVKSRDQKKYKDGDCIIEKLKIGLNPEMWITLVHNNDDELRIVGSLKMETCFTLAKNTVIKKIKGNEKYIIPSINFKGKEIELL